MKFLSLLLSLLFIFGCGEDGGEMYSIDDVRLRVTFGDESPGLTLRSNDGMTYETPQNYLVALKSAVLKGAGDTESVELFRSEDLSSSLVFDFTDTAATHSLLQGAEIPDGNYSSIEIEIYYLQMNLAIATGERGVERRNIRIYLSDDAETEGGLHQPGDMTQINEGVEVGWLLGEGVSPNMDPVSPREAAYTAGGDGVSWYDFAGKNGADYGPFGDPGFMSAATHPVYSTEVGFSFNGGEGSELILDFDVENCWQFEDKSGDGVFGADDLDPVNPTRWHMELPQMSVSLQ
jgi:hypothetical protein